MTSPIRVRFAPSPTGFMHLGSVRIAVMNYLFARQKKGAYILRIEDTDLSRNLDEAKLRIIKDLEWLKVIYQEGPLVGGPHAPYVQSERNAIYQEQLDELINNRRVYRCFCTPEELEAKRKQQIATGRPPRYARTCMNFSDEKIKSKIAFGTPCIWRFKLNDLQELEINDMAKGKITFHMKNFSDFALTRADGTFTFIFVNFVDDWLMKISHVIRGEDHLSNTANQAALYDAYSVTMPTFWHQPIICNKEGEKLSKRDFGFSLEDLKEAGFLPEAIINYMATVGASFAEEIQSLEELAKNYNFEHVNSTASIRYDVDKLTWFNHKWITKISPEDLYHRITPELHAHFPESKDIDQQSIIKLLEKTRENLKTLKDCASQLGFFFKDPIIDLAQIEHQLGKEKAQSALNIIKNNREKCESIDTFLDALKLEAAQAGLKTKEIFSPLRYLLTGHFEGLGMHDLLAMLDKKHIRNRLNF